MSVVLCCGGAAAATNRLSLHAPLATHLVEVVVEPPWLQRRLLRQGLTPFCVRILRHEAAAVHVVLSLAAHLQLRVQLLGAVPWLERRLGNLLESSMRYKLSMFLNDYGKSFIAIPEPSKLDQNSTSDRLWLLTFMGTDCLCWIGWSTWGKRGSVPRCCCMRLTAGVLFLPISGVTCTVVGPVGRFSISVCELLCWC